MAEDAPPIIQVVGLNHWLRMGPDVVSAALEGKGPKLSQKDRSRMNDEHALVELYLVLGGDPDGPRFTKQTGDYADLLHSLTYMPYVVTDAGFDGIVIFHDFGDAVSVFCTTCIRNEQAAQNWRAKEVGVHGFVNHTCASLCIQGPTMKIANADGTVSECSSK